MNSRPLPYQGSALPLSYASLKNPTLQSYRERSLPSTTRKAKNASNTRQRFRYLPGSIVLQAPADNSPNTISATTILPLPAGLKSTLHQPYDSLLRAPIATGTTSNQQVQLSGAQGRIRTSVTQRVADLQSAAINHSATCAHAANPANTRASSLPIKSSRAPGSLRRMVKPLVEILEEWWSVACQNDPQIQPNPKT